MDDVTGVCASGEIVEPDRKPGGKEQAVFTLYQSLARTNYEKDVQSF